MLSDVSTVRSSTSPGTGDQTFSAHDESCYVSVITSQKSRSVTDSSCKGALYKIGSGRR